MKKTKKIIKTIILILAVIVSALAMCVTMLIGTLGSTLMNNEYMKEELSSKGVYKGITDEVKSAVKDEYYKSSYRDEMIDELLDDLLDTVILPDLLQKETEEIIDQLYSGEQLKLNAKYFEEDYSQSIYTFVEARNANISRAKIESILATVTDAVSSNVDLTEYTDEVSEEFMKIFAYIILVLLGGLLLTGVMFLLILLLSREKLRNLSFPYFISGLLMLLLSLAGAAMLGDGVRVLNDSMSDFINSVFRKMIGLCVGYGFKNLLTGVVLLAARKIWKIIRNKKKDARPAAA